MAALTSKSHSCFCLQSPWFNNMVILFSSNSQHLKPRNWEEDWFFSCSPPQSKWQWDIFWPVLVWRFYVINKASKARRTLQHFVLLRSGVLNKCLFPIGKKKILWVTIAIIIPSPSKNYYCYPRWQLCFFLVTSRQKAGSSLKSIKGSPKQDGERLFSPSVENRTREPWLTHSMRRSH